MAGWGAKEDCRVFCSWREVSQEGTFLHLLPWWSFKLPENLLSDPRISPGRNCSLALSAEGLRSSPTEAPTFTLPLPQGPFLTPLVMWLTSAQYRGEAMGNAGVRGHICNYYFMLLVTFWFSLLQCFCMCSYWCVCWSICSMMPLRGDT